MSGPAIKRPDLKKTIAKVGVPSAADIPSKIQRKPLRSNAKPGETTGKDSPSDAKPLSKPVRPLPGVKSKESKLEAELKEARRQKRKLEQDVQALQIQLKDQKTKADRAKKRTEEADQVFTELRKVLRTGRDAKAEDLPVRVAQRIADVEADAESSITQVSSTKERLGVLEQELQEKAKEILRLKQDAEPILINIEKNRQLVAHYSVAEHTLTSVDEEVSRGNEVIPSFFAEVTSDDGMPIIARRYQTWILGLEEFKGRDSRTRNGRIDVGINPEWTIDNLMGKDAITLEGEKGLRVEIRSTSEDWRLRFEHPDNRFEGTTWSNVVHLIALPEGGTCVRHSVVRSTGANTLRPEPQGVPKIFRDLLRKSPASQIWSNFKGDARWVREDGIEDFVANVLLNPERDLPVVYISNAASSGNPLVDPDVLAKTLDGLAVVFVQFFENKFLLSDELQKKGLDRQLSCFDGGVRLFQPGLSRDADPFKHPLWLRTFLERKPATIRPRIIARSVATSAAGLKLPPAFTRLIEDFDLQNAKAKSAQSAATGNAANQVSTLQDEVRALESALEYTKTELASIPGLRQEIEAFKAEATYYLEACGQAERERDVLKDELQRTRKQVFDMQAKLKAIGGDLAEEIIPIPETYDELPEWVEKHLADKLVLHPRTRRSLKDADYENVEQVYRALVLLASDYRGMRMGLQGFSLEQFNLRCLETDLELGKSITSGRAGEFRDDYYVNWPVGSASEEFIEFHLRKGNSKETRYCLAIYFFWDPDSSQVVVCWLPSHLPNRMT
jgi:hypothetical protein